MIMLVYIIYQSLIVLRGIPCFHDLSHGMVHPIPILSSFIQLNDFCTCSTFLYGNGSYVYPHACVRA